MAIITMQNRQQTVKPPRVERTLLPDGKSELVTIAWGESRIILDPSEAQKLADALTAVLAA